MLRSYSNLLLSVRRVTQENQGRKTAGIDKQTALTPKARVRLLRDMETYQLWKAKPTGATRKCEIGFDISITRAYS
ncbi:MAG: reverse transcriptase N-terminal domain-containing protein [Trichormus sp. ATA11-4-KO1]|nr:reverse transcriptase N-terminal domain-containing protein [Trichormus sp. ATA11-4-KO1]